MNQSLQLNIIPFNPPIKEIACAFIMHPAPGYSPVHKDDLGDQWRGLIREEDMHHGCWIYTDFSKPDGTLPTLLIDLTQSIYLAQHYYRHLLRAHFRPIADAVHVNFTSEVEVWFEDTAANNPKYRLFNQFTLKVQHQRVTGGPELVVSFDGRTKVYRKSLAEISGVETEYYKWMLCGKELHKYKYLPEYYKLRLGEVYPVLSNDLKPLLGIAFDVPNFDNRYPKYRMLLTAFYEQQLNNAAFGAVFPLSSEGYFNVPDNLIRRIPGTSNTLQFGRGTGNTPKRDMVKLGPCVPAPPPNNIRFFFIYHEPDRKPFVENIYNWFMNGFASPKGSFPKMAEFIQQPFSIEEDSLVFKNPNTVVKEVYEQLRNKSFRPNTKYFAIYISPFHRAEADRGHRRSYHRMKEMLLHYGIYSQFIYRNNILREDYNYHLPNIEVAILAKIGGVPWRLLRPSTNELIVGIGAHYDVSKKKRFVGSAFCFNNEGEFQGFDCFSADDTQMIAGSIRKAVINYVAANINAKTGKNIDRLIIHFYKDIGKKEMRPIQTMLDGLNLKDITIIIITINKTESKELIAWDLADQTNLMPYSGTIIKVGDKEYLLFNNTRYDEQSRPGKKEYHFPIKLYFSCSDTPVLENTTTITELIDQVYQFSRMYWKSISQQSLPVTICYPEMVAEIFPYFKNDSIPEFGKKTLWFL